MADDERPTGDDGVQQGDLASLGQKLDTVAGAVAAIAGSHSDLLSHVAEAEARRSHDAREVAQRLGALERQVLALPSQAVPAPVDPLDPFPAPTVATDLEQMRNDLTLGLDVLAQVAEGVRRLDVRVEREAAELAELSDSVASLREDGPVPVREQLVEVAETVQAISERLPGLKAQLLDVRDQLERLDLTEPLAAVTRELTGRLTLHTDTALAGALRVIDDRLAALRNALMDAGAAAQASAGGFEAGAVMGAAQAAWNRLEQRLDAEFDDLGRQLQAMAALIERAAASAEAAANRPVVTTDQLRKAASAVKDSVTSAGRSRRDRRGGPKGLGTGTGTDSGTSADNSTGTGSGPGEHT